MKTAGIIGGSGYTGGELIRLIINHPRIDLDFVYSTTRQNTLLSDTHPDLLGNTNLCFTNKINEQVEIVFLCLGHGKSLKFLEKNIFSDSTIIIDLSNDFRLNKNNTFNGREFIYGLPEYKKENIDAKMPAWKSPFMSMLLQLYKEYAENDIYEPDIVQEFTKNYQKSSDCCLEFIEENIEITNNNKAIIIFTERPDRGLITLNGIARNTNNNAEIGKEILQ
jgi:N-acetyl-gamma-glutamyl-phosphate reductase